MRLFATNYDKGSGLQAWCRLSHCVTSRPLAPNSGPCLDTFLDTVLELGFDAFFASCINGSSGRPSPRAEASAKADAAAAGWRGQPPAWRRGTTPSAEAPPAKCRTPSAADGNPPDAPRRPDLPHCLHHNSRRFAIPHPRRSKRLMQRVEIQPPPQLIDEHDPSSRQVCAMSEMQNVDRATSVAGRRWVIRPASKCRPDCTRRSLLPAPPFSRRGSFDRPCPAG